MPALASHQSKTVTKMLLLGDSGAGKTGALASLAHAGYNLRILDLDNGIDVLVNLLTDPASKYAKDSASRVIYQTLTETMSTAGGTIRPAKATVWQNFAKQLMHWKTDDEDLGPITTWGPQDVLVVDSLSMACNAAMNLVLSLEGKLGKRPELQHWGAAQDMVELLMQLLYDDSVKCNVIIMCHVAYIDDHGISRGYPAALGKALPPKLGRYFNSTLMVRTTGTGQGQKRQIHTASIPGIELKNTIPVNAKSSYELGMGLAEYFSAIRRDPAKPTS
jgi:hypothetical protein